MLNIKQHRPAGATILAILAFLLAAWNGLRLWEAIYFWKTLARYDAPPLYIAISGGVWLVTGVLLTWGLWRGKFWARGAVLIGISGYTIWYWFDRLALQQPHANWPFALIVTVVFLSLILFILFSRKTKQFFQRDAHERKSENPISA